LDYFYQPDIISDVFHLDEEESRHCAKVLRKKVEDQIIVLDGNGGIYTCKIKGVHHKKVEFEVTIHLVIAPTKNADRIEWVIEKSIEIGLREISFINCHNSERHRLNMARMRKKAISAMKQCQNPYLTVVNDILSFENYLDTAAQNSEKYLCHAFAGKGNFLLNIAKRGASYQVLIGPEGDFTKEELSQAVKKGFNPVSLGDSRLRTETAGLVACVLLNALNLNT
jgi:16S rRNA (uracil1498-N3)-methyltransferase